MSKRKLKVEFAEAVQDRRELRVVFNRPLSKLEADGILYHIEAEVRNA